MHYIIPPVSLHLPSHYLNHSALRLLLRRSNPIYLMTKKLILSFYHLNQVSYEPEELKNTKTEANLEYKNYLSWYWRIVFDDNSMEAIAILITSLFLWTFPFYFGRTVILRYFVVLWFFTLNWMRLGFSSRSVVI